MHAHLSMDCVTSEAKGVSLLLLLGDVRAQELVGELFEKVRGDNDPDDEGQVRDVLCKLTTLLARNVLR